MLNYVERARIYCTGEHAPWPTMRTLTRRWIRLGWRARTSHRQRSTRNTVSRNLTSSRSLGREVCTFTCASAYTCFLCLHWNSLHKVVLFSFTGQCFLRRADCFQSQTRGGLQEEPDRDGWARDKACKGRMTELTLFEMVSVSRGCIMISQVSFSHSFSVIASLRSTCKCV